MTKSTTKQGTITTTTSTSTPFKNDNDNSTNLNTNNTTIHVNRNTTPTASRARNTGRRVQVWMKQQWRERNIPVADFTNHNNNNNNNNNNNDNGTTKVAAAASPVTSPRPPRGMTNMATTTPVSNRNLRRSSSSFSATSASASRSNSFQITTPLRQIQTTITPGGTSTSTVIVSNVDQALEALASQYKFQDTTQFPRVAYLQNNDNDKDNGNNCDAADDNNNEHIIVDKNYVDDDWILDGYEEWYHQYQITSELMHHMYPHTRRSNSSETQISTTTEETSKKLMAAAAADDDEETQLLLLKYGSAMGQQEYQFASFGENTRAFAVPIPVPIPVPISTPTNSATPANKNNTGNNGTDFDTDTRDVKMIAVSTTTERHPENGDDQDHDHDHDGKKIRVVNESEKIVTNDDDGDDDDSSNNYTSDQYHPTMNEATIATGSCIQRATATTITTTTTKVLDCQNNNDDNSDIGSDNTKKNNVQNSNGNGNNNDNGVGVGENENENEEGGVRDDSNCNSNSNSNTATGTGTNFETFWQDAVDAPTPDTGTFPSSSTYMTATTTTTSPIVPIQHLHIHSSSSSSSPTKLASTTVSFQDDNDQVDISFLLSPPPSSTTNVNINNNDVEEDDDDDDDDENDFCDFQTAVVAPSATTTILPSLTQQNDDKDAADIVAEDTADNDSCLEEEEVDDDDDDDDDKSQQQHSSRNNKNSSFDTAYTATATAIENHDDNERHNSMHTGITPLKKNGLLLRHCVPDDEGGDDTNCCHTPTITHAVVGDAGDGYGDDNAVVVVRSPLFPSLEINATRGGTKTTTTNHNNSNNCNRGAGFQTPRTSPTVTQQPLSHTSSPHTNDDYSASWNKNHIELPTPVIRNYHHYHCTTTTATAEDSGNLGGRRMIVVEPATVATAAAAAATNKGTPERPFRFDEINNVMSGIVTTVPQKTNGDNTNDDDNDEEDEVESKTSLWTDSSIPSVVQLLFTKTVGKSQELESKAKSLSSSSSSIVVPNTVLATRPIETTTRSSSRSIVINPINNTDTTATTTTTGTRLSLPSFRFGKRSFPYDTNNTIDNVNAASVAAASASLLSMQMMMGPDNNTGTGFGGGNGTDGTDEPSTCTRSMNNSTASSLKSPELKFLRRRNSQSKLLRQQQQAQRRHHHIRRRKLGFMNNNDDSVIDGENDEIDNSTYGEEEEVHDDSLHNNNYDGDTYDEENDSDSDTDSDELDDDESLSLGSLSTLPNQYWKYPELDHTLQELRKLEWDWLPYWQMEKLVEFDKDNTDTDNDNDNTCNTDNVPLFHEQITDRLSKLDSFYGKICKKVYKRIQPHAEELIIANAAALDLQQNLQLSHMMLIRSQKSIELAKYGRLVKHKSRSAAAAAAGNTDNDNDNDNAVGDNDGNILDEENFVGVDGALRLLDLWDTQQSFQELSKMEQMISEICDLEGTVTQLIENFDTYQTDSLHDCDNILNLVQELQHRLQEEPVNRLVCFDDIRERTTTTKFISETFLSRLLYVCLADITIDWCHHSSASSDTIDAYSRLIQTMIRVNNQQHHDGGIDDDDTIIHPTTTVTTHIDAICTSIQTTLLLETQKAFGRSLLDPTDSENEESEYEQELVALSNNEIYLDSSRIPIWTHNLVTIRFEFEMKQQQQQQQGRRRRQYNPLPAVFHKLCLLLTDILCGMHHLIEWHNNNTSTQGGISTAQHIIIPDMVRLELHQQLQTRRASIWNSCIQSIEECLEEYLKFSGGTKKEKLFSRNENNEYDDSKWREDVEGLHDVSILTHQFLSLGPLFLHGISKDVVNDGSMIEEKLFTCCKTHLRSFHIEAMTTFGTALYREDWRLFSINEARTTTTNTSSSSCQGVDDSTFSLEYIVKYISEQLCYQGDGRSTQSCRSRCNGFTSTTAANGNLLSEYRNPFEIDRDRMDVVNTHPFTHHIAPFDSNDVQITTIVQLLRKYVEEGDKTSPNIMLRCFFGGVLPWTARLLIIIDKIPSLVEEACTVLTNIFDLYITTAFRLCAGNASNERVLLGIDDTFQQLQNENYPPVFRENQSSSPMFGFGLRTKPTQERSKPPPVISVTAEAELCTFVTEEQHNLVCLREFLLDSQESLQGVAKLDLVDNWILDPLMEDETVEEDFAEQTARVLEKRQAVSFNHIFLTIGLHLATKNLPESCARIKSYTDRVLEAVPLLIDLCSRISCMRSIRGKTLLTEIISVDKVWRESKLHEQSNSYVDEFCDFLALVWYNLSTCPGSRRLPNSILKILWENLVGGGYMVLLDGFSKVPYCSTEGRSLMSMDVATYNSGVSVRSIASRLENQPQPRCPLPNNIHPYRNMSYVNTYIKLFYYPPNDALEWIRSNFMRYHPHHAVALVINHTDSKNLTKQVMNCYQSKTKAANIIKI